MTLQSSRRHHTPRAVPTRAICRSMLMALVMALLTGAAMPGYALPQQPTSTPAQLALQPIIARGAQNLIKPVFLTHANDGSRQLYIVEQNGRIRVLTQNRLHEEPFVDLSSHISTGGELGLLGLAFHPAYRTNGRVFVNYTRRNDHTTIIAEYRAVDGRIPANAAGRVLLTIPQPYTNHNGGMLAFGPDGNLYIATGDGGARGDPEHRAQNPATLLGKFLRINVDGDTHYTVPATNPYAQAGGAPEVFALGFRNPWRFSFDRKTGTLWAGDVGQNSWEEIVRVSLGENHGWRFMEGTHCFNPPQQCRQPTDTFTSPVLDYAHDDGRCSVTGGYVYRGTNIPGLRGTYLFADFCSGEIFGYTDKTFIVLLDTDLRISSFGEDEAGELYVLGYQGSIHRLVAPAP